MARRTGVRWHALGAVLVAVALGVLLLRVSQDVHVQLRAMGKLALEAELPLHPGDPDPTATRRVTLHIRNNAKALARFFGTLGYKLAAVHSGADVPRLFLSELPKDLDAVLPVERRKSLFLRAVLPLVVLENERLVSERAQIQRLQRLLERGEHLKPQERLWLERLYDRYSVEPGDVATLLRRVDVVPPSLALAQAATESAWGTSRFVQEGNALFGMWTWSKHVPGIVPRERDEDASHRVRAFDTLDGSVRAYMHTLNTHWAYQEFRNGRAAQRRQGQRPSGLGLVASVGRYSEQREAYIGQLRSLIRGNRLHRLDATTLASSARTAALPTGPALGQAALIAQEPGR